MIYLYLKTHNKTGLSYLGKTKNDPYKYKGSGTYWKRHLEKHGNDVSTIVLESCENLERFGKLGSVYSLLWDVVNSKKFANLQTETGQSQPSEWEGQQAHLQSIAHLGGKKGHVPWNKGISNPRTPESIDKQRKTLTGKNRGKYKTNGNNPRATKVTFRGIEYPSISHAREATGASHYTITKQHRRT